MMKRICDICGHVESKTLQVDTRFFLTGRDSDGAGSMVDTGKHYDLCTDCELSLLRRFVKRACDPRNKLLKFEDRYKPGEQMISIIKEMIDDEKEE